VTSSRIPHFIPAKMLMENSAENRTG